MFEVVTWVLVSAFTAGIILAVAFILFSFKENERRAAYRMFMVLPFLMLFAWVLLSGFVPGIVQLLVLVAIFSGTALVFFRFGNKTVGYKLPKSNFDERDVMFSRAELKEGTAKFEEYYKRRPQNKTFDYSFRKAPGLLNNKSKYYNHFLFNAADATFATVNLLQPLVEGGIKESSGQNFTTKSVSGFLRNWTIKLGAHSVGFTLLQPHHLYSHIGRGENYGNPVRLEHKFAIAFTVEMNHGSLSYAPKGPVVMESSQQYLNAGAIAVQVAQFIRNLGFDARAHIDANYRVICPVVAMDAGLGTIGRMGLLMTPKLGPRVRVAVVTTNLELETVNKPIDSTVISFCNICKKCASNCPSTAISAQPIQKNKPWKINHEKCFSYWCKIGTDCGRCITVCPYSHPNNFIHNIIRWTIKRNPVTRWFALKLDDLFYGKKPSILPLKNWMGIQFP